MKNSILSQFLYDNKLKFSQIENKLKCRSNNLSYHLKNMVKNDQLVKEKDEYKLSENTTKLIPYITDKNSVISVILIAIEKEGKIFLIKRNKRPFKNNKWCMPGGRIVVGETIPKATKRIMLEKYNIETSYKYTKSISLEHVKENNKIIHSFMLIFVVATTKAKLSYKNIKSIKRNIVESDYNLLNHNLNSKIKIKTLYSKN